MFELKKIDKLLSYRFYNYKINLFLNKKLEFDSLYNMFKNELFVLKKYLKNNLNKKFIKFNKFDCFSFVLFVKKLEKNLRFCVNYRKLNVIIKKNRYSLLLIQKTFDRLCNVKYFIKIDIMIVFNRFKMFFENEKYIAFKTRFDLFEYLIMFFDLCNVFVN